MAKYPDVTAGQTEAFINRIGGWNNFLRYIGGQGRIVFDTILELVKPDVKVSAHDKFVVADNFKKGNAGIYFIGDNFQKWFGTKVEEGVPSGTLSSRRLTEQSVDGPIKAELGEGHETYLAWLFEKIVAQADGREGELLTNGYANIFYVDGRVVSALWDDGVGWRVDAYLVTDPGAWNADYRVFSRNSVIESSEALVSSQS
ncbi:MAG: hypothetical protein ABL899_02885 [Nitrospira sp.]